MSEYGGRENNGYFSRQITRLIIPFSYQKTYKEAVSSLDPKHWETGDFSNHRLFRHINRLISSKIEYRETIGKRFVLLQGGRKVYHLPNNSNTMFTLLVKGRELCKVAITAFELFLFETQVGFLVYELQYSKGTSIDSVINGNYYIKKLYGDECRLHYKRRTGEDQSFDEYLDLGDLSFDLLCNLCVTTFFESAAGRDEDPRPLNALVYTGIVLERSFIQDGENPEALIQEYLFRMRRSFKESYKSSAFEFDINNNPEIMQFFDNSYWGVSLEGLANIVHLVDDKTTNDFFTGTYFGYLGNTYFYIYMLALHQRYVLLQLSIEVSMLPDSLEQYMSMTQTTEHGVPSLSLLRERIAFSIMRCLFRQVSNVNHHAKLYEAIRKTLGIEDLLEELHFEIEVLSSLAELKENKEAIKRREEEQRQKQLEEEKENRFKNFILIFSTLFVVISTTADSWNIFLNLAGGNYPRAGSGLYILFVMVLTIMWGLLFSTILYYYFVMRDFKRKKQNRLQSGG